MDLFLYIIGIFTAFMLAGIKAGSVVRMFKLAAKEATE